MARDRFAVLKTKRIDLSDGDWIDIKTGLTAGEQRIQDSLAIVPTRLEDGTVVDRIDWSQYEFLRADLWITDWSLTQRIGDKDQPRPKTVSALKALDPDDFDEINTAVYTHIQDWIKAKKAKRAESLERPPNGNETNSSPTSQS